LAEELVVLYIGMQADAESLQALLVEGDVLAHVIRAPDWRTVATVSAGWDVLVAGGRVATAGVDDVRAGCPAHIGTPVLAVVEARPPLSPLDGHIEWFEREDVPRLVPVLRALWRASVAEGRLRQMTQRAEMLERQLRQTGRLHALGQMAAGVAHEFNNVLTVISGYCEQLLPKLRAQEELSRHVRPIQQAAGRGAELSQRLLTFSRHQSPTVGDVSLTAVVTEASQMLVPLLGETVAMRVHLDHAVPRVRGHAGHLVEVITNLAVNARDAMPAGGTITVETAHLRSEGGADIGQVTLVVRDTGVGMDAETLQRACEPFFTTKGQGEGTGLGLSLVCDLVEQCGGSLSLASTPGEGTTVTVTLPAVREDESRAEEPGASDHAPGGFETVLVVEDDADVREIVTQFLRGAAYYVVEARDADEALALVTRGTRAIDLMVTDIVLPGQSGPALAGALREFAPQMRTLFISGYPSDSVREARSPQFLAKPFSRAAFLQAVRRALSAPRHRDVDATGTHGRLSDRERDTSQEQIRNGSH